MVNSVSVGYCKFILASSVSFCSVNVSLYIATIPIKKEDKGLTENPIPIIQI